MAVHGFLFANNAQNNSFAALTPVADETAFITGNKLAVPPGHTDIVAAAGIGSNFIRLQFDSPMLRKMGRVNVPYVNKAALPSGNLAVPKYENNPPKVDPGEYLYAYAEDDAGAANRKTAALWLSDGPVSPVTGQDARLIHGTATFAAVPYAWTVGQLVLETELQAGRYAVIGFRAQGTTCIAARMIFPKQGFRSMVLGMQGTSDRMDEAFLDGTLGSLGEFQSLMAPKIETYCTAADAKVDVDLNLVKVG